VRKLSSSDFIQHVMADDLGRDNDFLQHVLVDDLGRDNDFLQQVTADDLGRDTTSLPLTRDGCWSRQRLDFLQHVTADDLSRDNNFLQHVLLDDLGRDNGILQHLMANALGRYWIPSTHDGKRLQQRKMADYGSDEFSKLSTRLWTGRCALVLPAPRGHCTQRQSSILQTWIYDLHGPRFQPLTTLKHLQLGVNRTEPSSYHHWYALFGHICVCPWKLLFITLFSCSSRSMMVTYQFF